MVIMNKFTQIASLRIFREMFALKVVGKGFIA